MTTHPTDVVVSTATSDRPDKPWTVIGVNWECNGGDDVIAIVPDHIDNPYIDGTDLLNGWFEHVMAPDEEAAKQQIMDQKRPE